MDVNILSYGFASYLNVFNFSYSAYNYYYYYYLLIYLLIYFFVSFFRNFGDFSEPFFRTFLHFIFWSNLH